MASLAAIRERLRSSRLDQLRQQIGAIVPHHPGSEVWLFGSLARGDWDAYSDIDLLAVAPSKADAAALADALQAACIGDDVLALSTDRWQQLKNGDDPYWRAIGQEALPLVRP